MLFPCSCRTKASGGFLVLHSTPTAACPFPRAFKLLLPHHSNSGTPISLKRASLRFPGGIQEPSRGGLARVFISILDKHSLIQPSIPLPFNKHSQHPGTCTSIGPRPIHLLFGGLVPFLPHQVQYALGRVMLWLNSTYWPRSKPGEGLPLNKKSGPLVQAQWVWGNLGIHDSQANQSRCPVHVPRSLPSFPLYPGPWPWHNRSALFGSLTSFWALLLSWLSALVLSFLCPPSKRWEPPDAAKEAVSGFRS